EEVRNYINSIRRDIANRPLNREHLHDDPMEQFAIWMEEAVNGQIVDPFAMCLSTVGANGKPSSRIVYWRDVEDGGFVFYTNYDSHKGKEIDANPNVALNFHWTELERQIRIEGTVVKASAEVSDLYWSKRPRESQLGAWASAQSKIISDKDELQKGLDAAKKKFDGVDVPRPPHWGGFTVQPNRIEFWQGRPNRLHDRFVYSKKGDGWEVGQLSP
ncbi:MAG: pyridoxamine 5'-phosphate oxidase, partial [Flavobacteriales bacterium]|nr:pyridoxamine 5'-phosphate oxidase [Flavobacteriales bacterium]